MTMKRMGVAVCVLMLSTGAAMSAPIFLASQDATLYRTDGIVTETFALGDDIVGMAVAEDGTIWATSRSDDDGDGLYELYTLTDPLGPNPSLTFWGDFLEGPTPTLSVIQGTLYGYQKIPGQSLAKGQLVTIDTGAMTQGTVGATGRIGVATAGTGYDPVNDILYAISSRPTGGLYTVDYGLTSGPDPTATFVGPMLARTANHGAEFFDDTLYAAVQYAGGGPMALGWVDTDTGVFNETMILGPPSGGEIALAVVPEPTAITLLGLGGLALLRRRRA